MSDLDPVLALSHAWVSRIFEAKAVTQGGIVRRQCRDVDRHASLLELEQEVRRRGFRMVRNRDQLIIFCNTDVVEVRV